ncbi:MAG TPA: GntR family transcriptional regulator [Anaerolineae bacterium]|nr:GntR family transcriptional regulator [Anaerolineae bacterium]
MNLRSSPADIASADRQRSITGIDQLSSLRLNRRANTPLFKQIAAQLRQQIEQGTLHLGDVIPGERELAESLDVSRMTLRAAIDELVDEGLLLRQRGRGTVVAHVRINKQAQVMGFMSFSEEMHSRGLEPSSRILAFKSEVADAGVAAQLDLPLGAQVILLKRVRLANGEPMALERCYVPYERFRRLLNFDLSTRSLYDILEKEFDTRPTLCEETVEAIALAAPEARELRVKRGSPALLVTRVTRDARGALIEAEQTTYRSDRYRMVFIRQR